MILNFAFNNIFLLLVAVSVCLVISGALLKIPSNIITGIGMLVCVLLVFAMRPSESVLGKQSGDITEAAPPSTVIDKWKDTGMGSAPATKSLPVDPGPPAVEFKLPDWVIPTVGILIIVAVLLAVLIVAYFAIKQKYLIRKEERALLFSSIKVKKSDYEILKENFVENTRELVAAANDSNISAHYPGIISMLDSIKSLSNSIDNLGETAKTIELISNYSHRFKNITNVFESLNSSDRSKFFIKEKDKYNKLDDICQSLSKKIRYDLESLNGNGGVSVRSAVASIKLMSKMR